MRVQSGGEQLEVDADADAHMADDSGFQRRPGEHRLWGGKAAAAATFTRCWRFVEAEGGQRETWKKALDSDLTDKI